MESTYCRATDAQLIEWAKWRSYQSGEVKGYPSETPFRRLLGGSVRTALITDIDAEKVDRAVSRLSQRCPEQGEIIALYYLEHMTTAKIGREIHKGETYVRHELRSARNAIEWILDCT